MVQKSFELLGVGLIRLHAKAECVRIPDRQNSKRIGSLSAVFTVAKSERVGLRAHGVSGALEHDRSVGAEPVPELRILHVDVPDVDYAARAVGFGDDQHRNFEREDEASENDEIDS